MEPEKKIPKKIAIGCDHTGVDLKEDIKAFLSELGIESQDYGTYSTERTDYPIYGEKVARAVAAGEYELGILICGTGVGMSITANKIPGIRAAVCSEAYTAALSRQHNDSNILTFGARVVGTGLARSIVQAWLEAEYEGGRHARRVEMIAHLEQNPEVKKEQPL